MDVLDRLDIDIVSLTRGFFVLGAAAAISLHYVPSLRETVIDYGSRASHAKEKKDIKPKETFLRRLNFQVPHAWFAIYYAFSILCGVSWLVWLDSSSANSVLRHSFFGRSETTTTMSLEQVHLCMALLLIHSCRRLYECVMYTPKSSAMMPLSIFVVGIAFYFFVDIAIWVEGVAAYQQGTSGVSIGSVIEYVLARPLQHTTYLALFVFASWAQNRVHQYLSTLRKYTLPTHPLFTMLNVVSPHYTFEIILYISLALVAAPRGKTFNTTMLCVVLWTAINLGLVADDTRKWSIQKFGPDVKRRWRILPLIW